MKDTQLAQISLTKDLTGIIANPIYLSTAYQHLHLGQSIGYDYTRTRNPIRFSSEETFAKLEGDTASFATSSGMAVVQFIYNLFKPGDEILVAFDLYEETFGLFDYYEQQYGTHFKYVDFLNCEKAENSINKHTKALFIEPISNPQMIQVDVELYYILDKKHHLLTIINNTLSTSYLSTPLEQGADITLHSAIEYIGGHNDVSADVVTVKDDIFTKQLGQPHGVIGTTLSPSDCYLLQRGLKTLHLRTGRSQDSARRLVRRCETPDSIDEVPYSRKTGMLSLHLNRAYSVAKFLESLEIYILAEGLGRTETFITFPYTQTHVDMPDDEKDKRGIDEHLIRLSIDTEDYKDIEADIIQVLENSRAGVVSRAYLKKQK